MAEFLVQATFQNHTQEYFVIAGALLEGTITSDMCIVLPTSSPLGPALEIAAIEIVRRTDDSHSLALCTRYGSKEELHALQSLQLQGEIIEIRYCLAHTGAFAPLRMIVDHLRRFLT
jgi:hypothetical protein